MGLIEHDFGDIGTLRYNRNPSLFRCIRQRGLRVIMYPHHRPLEALVVYTGAVVIDVHRIVSGDCESSWLNSHEGALSSRKNHSEPSLLLHRGTSRYSTVITTGRPVMMVFRPLLLDPATTGAEWLFSPCRRPIVVVIACVLKMRPKTRGHSLWREPSVYHVTLPSSCLIT